MLGRKDYDNADAMIDEHEYWESRLLVLDAALLAICDEHGIALEAVLQLAGTGPFVPSCTDRETDAEYQAEIQAKMLSVLESYQR